MSFGEEGVQREMPITYTKIKCKRVKSASM